MPGKPAISLLLVLALPVGRAVAGCPPSTSDALRDPAPIREYFSLSSTFLGLDLRSARLLAAGCSEVDLRFTTANTFALSQSLGDSGSSIPPPRPGQSIPDWALHATGSPLFLVDDELHRIDLAWRHGLSQRTELGATIDAAEVGGGSMDGVVDEVHRFLKQEGSRRQQVPRNRQLILIRTPSEETTLDASRYESSDLVLSATRALTWSPRAQTSLRAIVKLPLVASPLGTSVDAAGEVLATRAFDRLTIHGSASIVRFGENQKLGTKGRTVGGMGASAVAAIGRKTALSVEFLGTKSPFASLGFHEFSAAILYAGATLHYAAGSNTVLHVSMVENLLHFRDSADISLQFGVTRRF
jgi:Protein of unknown function (DUF3187)